MQMFIGSDQVEVLHALIRIDNDRRLEETVELLLKIKNDGFLTRSLDRKSTGRFHCSTFSAVGSSILPSGSSNPCVPWNEWTKLVEMKTFWCCVYRWTGGFDIGTSFAASSLFLLSTADVPRFGIDIRFVPFGPQGRQTCLLTFDGSRQIEVKIRLETKMSRMNLAVGSVREWPVPPPVAFEGPAVLIASTSSASKMSLSLSRLESFELFDRAYLCQTTIFKVTDMVRSSSTHLCSSHIDDTSERLTSVFFSVERTTRTIHWPDGDFDERWSASFMPLRRLSMCRSRKCCLSRVFQWGKLRRVTR